MKIFSRLNFFSISIASVMLMSCAESGSVEKSLEEINLAEHDSLNTIKIHYSKIENKISKFLEAVDEQHPLIHYWVKEDSRTDAPEKLHLAKLEEDCHKFLSDLEPMMENDNYQKHFGEVSQNLNDLIIVNDQIRNLLASSDDYKDEAKRSAAMVLIVDGGGYDLAFNKLILSLNAFHNLASQDLGVAEVNLLGNEHEAEKFGYNKN